MSAFSLVVPPAGAPAPTPTDSSIPSPPDNTPTNPLSPIDDNDNAITSIISYHEQAPPAVDLSVPPLGYIRNDMDSRFFYPIYIKNQLHNSSSGEDKYILAPFIKYTSDYTQVHGTQGTGCEICTLPVQIGRVVRYANNMTTEMWARLRRGSEQQFMVDEALEQLGDPRLRGEVNYYRGKADVLDTLNDLYQSAMSEANCLMREVLTVEGEVRRSQQRLQRANAYDEIWNKCLVVFPPTYTNPARSPEPCPLPPRPRGPVEMPVLMGEEPHTEHKRRCLTCRSKNHATHKCHQKRPYKCGKCGQFGHGRRTCKIKLAPLAEGVPEPSPIEKQVATRTHPLPSLLERAHDLPKMTLLERLELMDRLEWTPKACPLCAKVDPGHNRLGCPRYEKCWSCGGLGAKGFVNKHTCPGPNKEDDPWMGADNDADMDLYWNGDC